MVNEIKKCEIDSSGGLLKVNGNNLLNCSDILTSKKAKEIDSNKSSMDRQ